MPINNIINLKRKENKYRVDISKGSQVANNYAIDTSLGPDVWRNWELFRNGSIGMTNNKGNKIIFKYSITQRKNFEFGFENAPAGIKAFLLKRCDQESVIAVADKEKTQIILNPGEYFIVIDSENINCGIFQLIDKTII